MESGAPSTGRNIVRFSAFEVDLTAGELRRDGVRLKIQDQPFQILSQLLERPGELVSREDVKRRLWPEDTFVDFERGLNSAVKKLRDVLGDVADSPRFIETIPKRGYRFIGIAVTEKRAAPSTASEAPSPSKVWAVIVLLLVVVSCLSLVFVMRRKREDLYFQNVKVTRLTSEGNIDSAAISPDGQYVAFATSAAGKSSLRVRRVSVGNSLEIASSNTAYTDLIYSPDGDELYYRQLGNATSVVYQIPSLGGESRRVTDDVDGAMTVSPDGRQIAFVRHNPLQGHSRLVIANSDGTGERVVIETPYPRVLDNPAWSREGTRLACRFHDGLLSDSSGLVTLDLGSAKQNGTALNHWKGIAQVAWVTHDDGLVFVAEDRVGFGRGQLFFLPFPQGAPRKITNGIDAYDGVSLSSDSTHLISILERIDSDLWFASSTDLDHPKQLASNHNDLNGYMGLAYRGDGAIVFSSRANGVSSLWIENPPDANARQLIAKPGGDIAPWVLPDGSVVFTSDRETGQHSLWHVDGDGSNLRQLTFGTDDRYPVATPDGRWVYYQSSSAGQSLILKISVKGGKPEVVSDVLSGPPAISPDGKILAYMGAIPDGFRLFVEPLDHSWTRRSFPVVAMNGGIGTIGAIDNIAWNADSHAVHYASEVNGVSNLWSQSILGGNPQQLTHFASGHIFAFAWSPDHKQLALAKGTVVRDVVVLDAQKR